MPCDRLAELNELEERAEDPFDRADLEMMKQVEFPETWCLPPYDFEDPDTWRQSLAAQIQMPDAAD